MKKLAKNFEDTGLEILDLRSDPPFRARPLRNRDANIQMQEMQRLGRVFVEDPSSILQELVNAAIDLCGADSAGISIENRSSSDECFYEWVATAGVYAPFLHATLPRHPSACGICLDRGQPQLFRVSQRFFDILGVTASTVADGILLPWEIDGMRGTIWVLSHERAEAFDMEDCRIMEMLADFAALAYRKHRQHTGAVRRAANVAASGVANDLAHKINNPLQSIVNQIYIAAISEEPGNARALAESLSVPIAALSAIVRKQLTEVSRLN